MVAAKISTPATHWNCRPQGLAATRAAKENRYNIIEFAFVKPRTKFPAGFR
jgi:hypothetical protein